MRKSLLVFILSILFPLTFLGQTRKVSGECIYYSDPNMTPKEAMAAAIENAKAQAIAKEFGTLITQNTMQEEGFSNGKENSYFIQLNASEVKGEWLEDIKRPEAKIVDTTPEGVLVIKAVVEGRARALSNEASDFEALTLRNGTEKRLAEVNFKEGDKLYLYFKAPADGYVAAYLIDESQNAFCLLPYEDDSDGQQPIIHGKEYVFFSSQHDADFNTEDGLQVTCEDEKVELNRIYVIYSPTPFVKAIDQQGNLLGDDLYRPRQLNLKELTQWMTKLCSRDKKVGRKVIPIRIRKAK